jgi:hypothetical protein
VASGRKSPTEFAYPLFVAGMGVEVQIMRETILTSGRV